LAIQQQLVFHEYQITPFLLAEELTSKDLLLFWEKPRLTKHPGAGKMTHMMNCCCHHHHHARHLPDRIAG